MEKVVHKNRIASIDIAKGIGIISVVLGHLLGEGQYLRDFIYAFHMPLFFIISGFLFHNKKFINSLKTLFKTLYIPYFFIIIFDSLIYILYIYIYKKVDVELNYVIFTSLKAAIGFGGTLINSPVWFLFSLFIIRIVFDAIMQIKNKKISYIILFLLSAAGVVFVFIYKRAPKTDVIIYLQSMPCFTFYCFGFGVKKTGDSLKNKISELKSKKFLYALAVVLSLFLVLSVRHNGYVSIHDCIYSNPILFFFNAFAGTFVVFLASILIEKVNLKIFYKLKNLLTYFGENSIVILITHYYFTRKIYPRILDHLGLSDYLYNYGVEFILLIITMAIMAILIELFNKYLYFIIGKQKGKQAKN